jgi:anti-sigma regulatory factor (Ser/Thr protein kinase)
VGGERLGTWRVSALPASVPELRRTLGNLIAGRGFDEDAVALAVTETVTNAVRHAYPGPVGTVTLSAEASADELVVVVTDQGHGSRSVTMRAKPQGLGMGLALIRELCASVSVEPTTTGTTVTMHFTKL